MNETQTGTSDNECGTSGWLDLSRRGPRRREPNLEACLKV